MAFQAVKRDLGMELARKSSSPDYYRLFCKYQKFLGENRIKVAMAWYIAIYVDLYCGNSTFLG